VYFKAILASSSAIVSFLFAMLFDSSKEEEGSFKNSLNSLKSITPEL